MYIHTASQVVVVYLDNLLVHNQSLDIYNLGVTFQKSEEYLEYKVVELLFSQQRDRGTWILSDRCSIKWTRRV